MNLGPKKHIKDVLKRGVAIVLVLWLAGIDLAWVPK